MGQRLGSGFALGGYSHDDPEEDTRAVGQWVLPSFLVQVAGILIFLGLFVSSLEFS